MKGCAGFVGLVLLGLSISAQAASLNTTGMQVCQNSLLGCLANDATNNASNITWINTTAFANCSNSFNLCMSMYGYKRDTKPLDCYLARSEWRNLYVYIAFSIAVFGFSNLVFPGVLKAIANSINWMHVRWGSGMPNNWWQYGLYYTSLALTYCTDADGDGKTTVEELTMPRTVFAFSSIAAPIYQYGVANDQQARCDYAKRIAPAA